MMQLRYLRWLMNSTKNDTTSQNVDLEDMKDKLDITTTFSEEGGLKIWRM